MPGGKTPKQARSLHDRNPPQQGERDITYRILFVLLAVFAVATLPDQASAQCMECGPCGYGQGEGCSGALDGGFDNCGQDGFPIEDEDGEDDFVCMCGAYGGPCQADEADNTVEEHLPMALASLRTGSSMPADGPLYYAVAGPDIVFRRKCNGEPVHRVAAAEVGVEVVLAPAGATKPWRAKSGVGG